MSCRSALDIFRGRYRDSFEHPTADPGEQACSTTSSACPTVNHVFQPGHRIMVQVQSSLFPLYDRNPQTFVPNIFFAKPADYQKATVTIDAWRKDAERGVAAGRAARPAASDALGGPVAAFGGGSGKCG